MWQIVLAAGWPIWPLILASVLAVIIIVERGIVPVSYTHLDVYKRQVYDYLGTLAIAMV